MNFFNKQIPSMKSKQRIHDERHQEMLTDIGSG